MAGPGKFFLTGFNVRFVDLPMLKDYLQQMVKMSPLQSYSLEIVEDTPEIRVIGAAVLAGQAGGREEIIRSLLRPFSNRCPLFFFLGRFSFPFKTVWLFSH